MAQQFNLTAQINLQSPKNVGRVVADIQRQLKGKGLNTVNIKVKADPRTLAQTNQQLQSVGKNSRNAAKDISVLNSNLREAARRFSVITVATGTLLGLVTGLKNATKSAIEFERELIKISQVTGKSTQRLQGLTQEVTRLSTTWGVASADILSVSKILAQAGFSAEKTRKALEILTQTSLGATFENIQDTTEGAIALLRQFSNEAKAAGGDIAFLEKSLSAINSVSKKFAVESGDLITVIRRVGGVFSAAGGEINELIALFTSVRSTTRESAETIATGLRTIFTRIQRTDTIDALKNLNIELRDSQGNFVGAYEAVRRLSIGLSSIDPRSGTFSDIAEQLGGFRQIGKVIPLIQQFAVAQDALNVAQGASGSTAKDASTAQQGLGVQITKVKQEFEALIRKFSDSSAFKSIAGGALAIASAMIKVADAITPLIPLLTMMFGMKIGRSLAPGIGAMAGMARRGGGGSIGVSKFAKGGVVPGKGNRDTVPAMLTPGEFVIRKSSVKKLGAGRLAQMNNNRYAAGGKAAKIDKVNKVSKPPVDGDTFDANVTPTGDAFLARFRPEGFDAYETGRKKSRVSKDTYQKILKLNKATKDPKTGRYDRPKELYDQLKKAPISGSPDPGREIPHNTIVTGGGLTASAAADRGTQVLASKLSKRLVKAENISEDAGGGFGRYKINIGKPLKPELTTGRYQKFALGGIATKNRVGFAVLDPDQGGGDKDATVTRAQVRAGVTGTNSQKKALDKELSWTSKTYKLATQGLPKKTSQRFYDTITEGAVTGVEKAASSLSSNLGQGAISMPKDAKATMQQVIKKSGSQMGALHEQVLNVIDNEGVFKPTPVGAPWDFKNGLQGGLKSTYNKMPSSFVDARTSYTRSTPAAAQGKIIDELVDEYEKGTGAKTYKSAIKQKKAQSAGVLAAQGKRRAKQQAKMAKEREAAGYAKGGAAPSDTVPALLTPGEFVINKSAASSIGMSNLDRMNKKGVTGFAAGGVVTTERNNYGIPASGSKSASGSGGGESGLTSATESATKARKRIVERANTTNKSETQLKNKNESAGKARKRIVERVNVVNKSETALKVANEKAAKARLKIAKESSVGTTPTTPATGAANNADGLPFDSPSFAQPIEFESITELGNAATTSSEAIDKSTNSQNFMLPVLEQREVAEEKAKMAQIEATNNTKKWSSSIGRLQGITQSLQSFVFLGAIVGTVTSQMSSLSDSTKKAINETTAYFTSLIGIGGTIVDVGLSMAQTIATRAVEAAAVTANTEAVSLNSAAQLGAAAKAGAATPATGGGLMGFVKSLNPAIIIIGLVVAALGALWVSSKFMSAKIRAQTNELIESFKKLDKRLNETGLGGGETIAGVRAAADMSTGGTSTAREAISTQKHGGSLIERSGIGGVKYSNVNVGMGAAGDLDNKHPLDAVMASIGLGSMKDQSAQTFKQTEKRSQDLDAILKNSVEGFTKLFTASKEVQEEFDAIDSNKLATEQEKTAARLKLIADSAVNVSGALEQAQKELANVSTGAGVGTPGSTEAAVAASTSIAGQFKNAGKVLSFDAVEKEIAKGAEGIIDVKTGAAFTRSLALMDKALQSTSESLKRNKVVFDSQANELTGTKTIEQLKDEDAPIIKTIGRIKKDIEMEGAVELAKARSRKALTGDKGAKAAIDKEIESIKKTTKRRKEIQDEVLESMINSADARHKAEMASIAATQAMVKEQKRILKTMSGLDNVISKNEKDTKSIENLKTLRSGGMIKTSAKRLTETDLSSIAQPKRFEKEMDDIVRSAPDDKRGKAEKSAEVIKETLRVVKLLNKGTDKGGLIGEASLIKGGDAEGIKKLIEEELKSAPKAIQTEIIEALKKAGEEISPEQLEEILKKYTELSKKHVGVITKLSDLGQSEIDVRAAHLDQLYRIQGKETKFREAVLKTEEQVAGITLRSAKLLAKSRGVEVDIRKDIAKSEQGRVKEANVKLKTSGVKSKAGDIESLSAEKEKLEKRRAKLSIEAPDKDGDTAVNLRKNKTKLDAVNKELERLANQSGRLSDLFGEMQANEAVIEKERRKREQVTGVIEEFVIGGQQTRKALVNAANGIRSAFAGGTLQNQSEEQRSATVGLLDKLSDIPLLNGFTGKEIKQELVFRDAIKMGLDPKIANMLATATTKEQKLIDSNERLAFELHLLTQEMTSAREATKPDVIPLASGGMVYRASGGSIFKPRGTDTVPAMLSPGEFVIRKSAVDAIGADNLAAMNNGGVVYRQGGGRGRRTAAEQDAWEKSHPEHKDWGGAGESGQDVRRRMSGERTDKKRQEEASNLGQMRRDAGYGGSLDPLEVNRQTIGEEKGTNKATTNPLTNWITGAFGTKTLGAGRDQEIDNARKKGDKLNMVREGVLVDSGASDVPIAGTVVSAINGLIASGQNVASGGKHQQESLEAMVGIIPVPYLKQTLGKFGAIPGSKKLSRKLLGSQHARVGTEGVKEGIKGAWGALKSVFGPDEDSGEGPIPAKKLLDQSLSDSSMVEINRKDESSGQSGPAGPKPPLGPEGVPGSGTPLAAIRKVSDIPTGEKIQQLSDTETGEDSMMAGIAQDAARGTYNQLVRDRERRAANRQANAKARLKSSGSYGNRGSESYEQQITRLKLEAESSKAAAAELDQIQNERRQLEKTADDSAAVDISDLDKEFKKSDDTFYTSAERMANRRAEDKKTEKTSAGEGNQSGLMRISSKMSLAGKKVSPQILLGTLSPMTKAFSTQPPDHLAELEKQGKITREQLDEALSVMLHRQLASKDLSAQEKSAEEAREAEGEENLRKFLADGTAAEIESNRAAAIKDLEYQLTPEYATKFLGSDGGDGGEAWPSGMGLGTGVVDHIDRIQKRIKQYEKGSPEINKSLPIYKTLERQKEMNQAGVEKDVAVGSLAASYDARARFGDPGLQKEESGGYGDPTLMLNPLRNNRNIVDTDFGPQDVGLNPLFIQRDASTAKAAHEKEQLNDPFARSTWRDAEGGGQGGAAIEVLGKIKSKSQIKREKEEAETKKQVSGMMQNDPRIKIDKTSRFNPISRSNIKETKYTFDGEEIGRKELTRKLEREIREAQTFTSRSGGFSVQGKISNISPDGKNISIRRTDDGTFTKVPIDELSDDSKALGSQWWKAKKEKAEAEMARSKASSKRAASNKKKNDKSAAKAKERKEELEELKDPDTKMMFGSKDAKERYENRKELIEKFKAKEISSTKLQAKLKKLRERAENARPSPTVALPAVDRAGRDVAAHDLSPAAINASLKGMTGDAATDPTTKGILFYRRQGFSDDIIAKKFPNSYEAQRLKGTNTPLPMGFDLSVSPKLDPFPSGTPLVAAGTAARHDADVADTAADESRREKVRRIRFERRGIVPRGERGTPAQLERRALEASPDAREDGPLAQKAKYERLLRMNGPAVAKRYADDVGYDPPGGRQGRGITQSFRNRPNTMGQGFSFQDYMRMDQQRRRMQQFRGGVMSRRGYRAAGGSMAGGDVIPAMLTPGEFVMSAGAVRQHGVGAMKSLNRGQVPGFNSGGMVGGVAYRQHGSGNGAEKGGGGIGINTDGLTKVFNTFITNFSSEMGKITGGFTPLANSIQNLVIAFDKFNGFEWSHNHTGSVTIEGTTNLSPDSLRQIEEIFKNKGGDVLPPNPQFETP